MASLDDPCEEAATLDAIGAKRQVDTPLKQDSPALYYDAISSESLSGLQSAQLCILDQLNGWLKMFESKFTRHSPHLIGRNIRLLHSNSTIAQDSEEYVLILSRYSYL